MKSLMIFIAIALTTFLATFLIVIKLRISYNQQYAKEFDEYNRIQRMKVIRDSIQADMKYRHDSIEFEYYKQHIKN